MGYAEHFRDNALKQFDYYKVLGERTFAQLSDDELFWQYNDESNSIAVMVKHISGNMLSRWTDFLNTDGEKEWRNRDQEFEVSFETREQLMAVWNKGWDCMIGALKEIDASNFDQTIYIRNIAHSITEAVVRQIAHIASHIGQIIYVGKMIKGTDWESLSIPRGQSEAFNQKSFDKGKRSEHYTQETINRDFPKK